MATASALPPDKDALFNHCFLPLKVPGESDNESHADLFYSEFCKAAKRYGELIAADHQKAWDNIILQGLVRSRQIWGNGIMCAEVLQKEIKDMGRKHAILVSIVAQNAAILITKKSNDDYILECWEVSATIEAVLNSQDALIRRFPGRAVLIKSSVMKDEKFLEELSTYIYQLNIETVHGYSMETSIKGNNSVEESRESRNPILVTQYLFDVMLASVGEKCESTILVKRTHDEVNFHRAAVPWRRSGVLASIKVFLQLSISRSELANTRHTHYKQFMLCFLCSIARNLLMGSLSLEQLHVIKAKLAARLGKMPAEGLPESLTQFIASTMDMLLADAERQHAMIRNESRKIIQPIASNDTSNVIQLPSATPSLRRLHEEARRLTANDSTSFIPPPDHPLEFISPSGLPNLATLKADGPRALEALSLFIEWTDIHLHIWASHLIPDEDLCTQLHKLMTTAWKSGQIHLRGHPAPISRLLLSIFDVWVALDRMAITLLPLLREYPVFLAIETFSELVLTRSSDWARLAKVQQYIQTRNDQASKTYPSLFDRISADSFAVKRFDQQPHLQAIRRKILDTAKQKKEALALTFAAQIRTYDRLISEARMLDHQQFPITKGRRAGTFGHDRNCIRCALEKQAAEMTIQKFEEPLPSAVAEQKAVVFEIDPGETIVAWRDATWFMQHDILSPQSLDLSRSVAQRIEDFGPYRQYYREYCRRISMASVSKPSAASHFIKSLVGSPFETLVLSHACKFDIYDTKGVGLFTAIHKPAQSLSYLCRPSIWQKAYRHLQDTIITTSVSSNSVIARQSTSPSSLTAKDHIAFGTLRAGGLLQPMNLLRSLLAQELDLTSSATIVAVEQMVFQVGNHDRSDSSFAERVDHVAYNDPTYLTILLKHIDRSIESISLNWKESIHAWLLKTLLLKAATIATSEAAKNRVLDLLQRLRRMALAWIRDLSDIDREQHKAGVEAKGREEIRQRLFQAVMLARATWHVDDEYLSLLLAQETDLTDYVILLIRFFGLFDHFRHCDNKWIQRCILRDQMSSYRLEDSITKSVIRNPLAVVDGIRSIWPSADLNQNIQLTGRWWRVFSGRNPVDFNIGTGQLLVAGKELSNLPARYLSTGLYKQVFGDTVLDVMPGSGSFEFQTSTLFHNHSISLSLTDECLLIQSEDAMAVPWIAVPRDIFRNDLPERLLEATEPWLDLRTSEIAFRSTNSRWASEKFLWKLKPLSDRLGQYMMESHSAFLINHHHHLGQEINRVMKPLDGPKYVEIEKSKMDDSVTVTLPRYHLHFQLTHGRMKCIELNAIICQDQSVGTLYGLQNLLVLEEQGSVGTAARKSLLIPYGKHFLTRSINHTMVSIDLSHKSDVIYYRYQLDQVLCTLATDQLEAQLFKALLSALTSTPLPDALTRCTGTESSFSDLKDYILLTCEEFSETARRIMSEIAQLVPIRSWYPGSHIKSMQSVRWNPDLPWLNQHDGFFPAVAKIIDHNARMVRLHGLGEPCSIQYNGDDPRLLLARRSLYAWQKLFGLGYIKKSAMPLGDTLYRSRDQRAVIEIEPAFEVACSAVKSAPRASPNRIYDMLFQRKQVDDFGIAFDAGRISDCFFVNTSNDWPKLATLCITSSTEDRYRLAFTMSLIVFRKPDARDVVMQLLEFAYHEPLKRIGLPAETDYDLDLGWKYSTGVVRDILKKAQIPEEFHGEILQRADDAWLDGEGESLVQFDDLEDLEWRTRDGIELMLNSRIQTWRKNAAFKIHCQAWEFLLRQQGSDVQRPSRTDLNKYIPNMSGRVPRRSFPSILQLVSNKPAPNATLIDMTGFDGRIVPAFATPAPDDGDEASENIHEELEELCSPATEIEDAVSRQYKQHLLSSVGKLKERHRIVIPDYALLTTTELSASLYEARMSIARIRGLIKTALDPGSLSQIAMQKAGLWPKLSTSNLLALLSRKNRAQLPKTWRSVLVHFSREITAFQRLQRCLLYVARQDRFALRVEMSNEAHAAWTIESDNKLDFLLFEISNNLLIRPSQIKITEKLLNSDAGVVQSQMGSGKSSVVMPLFCIQAANGKSLVRVIVLKALARQAQQSLSRSLSGLVRTKLYWLPFSRSTPLIEAGVQALHETWKNCVEERGIVLALPEHLNSFRLMGLDRLIDADSGPLSRTLLAAQKWLDKHSRDLIDEQDSVLHPRYELCYSNGLATVMTGAPLRWSILLAVFDLVQNLAAQVAVRCPNDIEYASTLSGAFPRMRIITETGARELKEAILSRIYMNELPWLSFTSFTSGEQQCLRQFIENVMIDDSTKALLQSIPKDTDIHMTLFLLRGLFAWDYLATVLQKRWRVEYGQAHSRCLAAVPYRSKNEPSTAAEFGQPEMHALLTALEWYQAGLRLEDSISACRLLLRLPDPGDEYGRWTSGIKVPAKLANVSCINLQDDICMRTLHTHLHKQKAMIDFFLKTIVYPKESRMFQFKLSTSAWDLATGSVGFSGTLDARMPDLTSHLPVEELEHLDAEVLATLLEPRNRQYFLAQPTTGTAYTTQELLEYIYQVSPKITVLIDIGAQIFESNEELARLWLRLRPDKSAAVFFSQQDEKLIVGQDGKCVAFNTSPYKDQLRDCLCVFDQTHTRGADIPLSDDAAAGVLLGPIQKDQLVQGCMRLRKLTGKQSVTFFGTPEIDRQIRNVLGLDDTSIITSKEIMAWSIHRSCKSLRLQEPLNLSRGLEFYQRRLANNVCVADNGTVIDKDKYIARIRSTEDNQVETLYSAHSHALTKRFHFNTKEQAHPGVAALLDRRLQMKEALGDQLVGLDLTRNDQLEREQVHEIEQEREVEMYRLASMTPRTPETNIQLARIIREDNGQVSQAPPTIGSAFRILRDTSIGDDRILERFAKLNLLATDDFIKTVRNQSNSAVNDFIRPVTWLVVIHNIKSLIIISPHEANELLPWFSVCTVATLIMYSPRVTKDAASFESLDVYTVPHRSEPLMIDPNILTALRLYSGQLWFDNFDQYERFCVFLGLGYNEQARPCGDEKDKNMRTIATKMHTAAMLVSIVKKWLDMRQKGSTWEATHVGRVLDGILLQTRDFVN